MKKATTLLFALSVTLCTWAQIAPPVVARNSDYSLVNSTIVTVKGKVVPGRYSPACQIEIDLPSGQRAIEARGMSPTRVTGDTCELEMEVGQPPDHVLPAYSPAPGAAPAPPLAAAGLVAPIPAATFGVSSGYAKGWVTDPIGIWVNSEQANLSWDWSTLCPSIVNWSESQPTPPYATSGWYELGGNSTYPTITCETPPRRPPVGTDSVTDTAFYENDIFPLCVGSQTNTVIVGYNPLMVHGNYIGSLWGTLAWEIYGPACINLLTPNFTVIRTYN